MTRTEIFESLADPVKALLEESGITAPTPPQIQAIPLVTAGANVLIVAPTGSGKTEAAILPLLSNLVRSGPRHGISLLYITPLRALNRDMLRRLEVWCSKLGLTIDVRHGDTPLSQRNKEAKELAKSFPRIVRLLLASRKTAV